VLLSFYGAKTTWDAWQGRRRSSRGLRGSTESGGGGSVRAGHAREEGDDAADMWDRARRRHRARERNGVGVLLGRCREAEAAWVKLGR